MIDIRDNPEMTRFGISNLKAFPNIWAGFLFVNLENNHPKFCLTTEEMMVFLESKVIFVNLHAKFCEVSEDMCRFSTMRELPNNCDQVSGTVIIGSGDEKYVHKLSRMTTLFGTLTIRNTILKDLNFLSSLIYIASLDGIYH
uniref:Recep_L_domain domain-containing protein n=1 Tax=Caenorhabditis tropicalis TaxID=1561998 RepID=A0A1I7UFH7_9PELO